MSSVIFSRRLARIRSSVTRFSARALRDAGRREHGEGSADEVGGRHEQHPGRQACGEPHHQGRGEQQRCDHGAQGGGDRVGHAQAHGREDDLADAPGLEHRQLGRRGARGGSQDEREGERGQRQRVEGEGAAGHPREVGAPGREDADRQRPGQEHRDHGRRDERAPGRPGRHDLEGEHAAGRDQPHGDRDHLGTRDLRPDDLPEAPHRPGPLASRGLHEHLCSRRVTVCKAIRACYTRAEGRTSTPDFASLYAEAIAAGRRRDYRQAADLFARVAGATDRFPLALLYLGRSRHALGEHGPAVRALSAFVRQRPASAAGRLFLGRAHLAVGDAEAAVRELAEAVRLRPDLAPAQGLLGLACLRARRFDEALAAFAAARRLAPDDARLETGYLNTALVAAVRAFSRGPPGRLRPAVQRGPRSSGLVPAAPRVPRAHFPRAGQGRDGPLPSRRGLRALARRSRPCSSSAQWCCSRSDARRTRSRR